LYPVNENHLNKSPSQIERKSRPAVENFPINCYNVIVLNIMYFANLRLSDFRVALTGRFATIGDVIVSISNIKHHGR
jgi:hypothetical protein